MLSSYCILLGGCTTALLTNGDYGDCSLTVIHTLWLCLSPVAAISPTLAALVGWRSWQSLTLTQLMHNWSWMVLHRCSSSPHSLTHVLSPVSSVQNFYCHWKFLVIHEDHILLNSRNGIIFQLNLIVEISKKWTHRNVSETFGWLW